MTEMPTSNFSSQDLTDACVRACETIANATGLSEDIAHHANASDLVQGMRNKLTFAAHVEELESIEIKKVFEVFDQYKNSIYNDPKSGHVERSDVNIAIEQFSKELGIHGQYIQHQGNNKTGMRGAE